MQTLILTLHIIVCVLLVILVLLQAGKEGMGVIFGGGNSSVFGSGGAGSILAKLTALMAVIFVITSISDRNKYYHNLFVFASDFFKKIHFSYDNHLS